MESKRSKHSPQKIGANKLKLKIKTLITAECTAAESADETVLIILFGHRDRDNYGIVLDGGKQYSQNRRGPRAVQSSSAGDRAGMDSFS